MSCDHFVDGRCTQLLFDGTPTARQCAACNRYSGPDRGLGDKLHRVIVSIGGKRIEKMSGCGCGRRRAALNRLSQNKD